MQVSTHMTYIFLKIQVHSLTFVVNFVDIQVSARQEWECRFCESWLFNFVMNCCHISESNDLEA